MFEVLVWATIAVALLGALCAYDGSRDVFHPLLLVAPMFLFLYGYMPLRLWQEEHLANYFHDEQLVHVQTLNLLGVAAFVAGCLRAGVRVRRVGHRQWLPALVLQRLALVGAVIGCVGLACWGMAIVNVGGFVNAFSRSYSGGWDDSGYVRDGAILLLAGVLLQLAAITKDRPRPAYLIALAVCGLPWLVQSLLTARRGPTFALCMVLAIGWFLPRGKRPALLTTAGAGAVLGLLVLFLVSNRSNIFLGSDREFTTDVSRFTEANDTGNEYIYGSGAVLSAERQGKYFWLRRYAAQILVRPIPSSIWPTKYEDFGVPELLHNAGTGEGFADALGWQGAVGSAPGIIADLWLEAWWLAVPLMALLGWAYGWVWKRAVRDGGPWMTQYAVIAALSLYLVMQTMEAVIFRLLLLSVPLWLAWLWALSAVPARRKVLEAEVTYG